MRAVRIPNQTLGLFASVVGRNSHHDHHAIVSFNVTLLIIKLTFVPHNPSKLQQKYSNCSTVRLGNYLLQHYTCIPHRKYKILIK